MRTDGTITGNDTELAERVEALLAELDERVEVYQDAGYVAPLEAALAWVAGRRDLPEATVAQLRELRRRRRGGGVFIPESRPMPPGGIPELAQQIREATARERGPAEVTD
jgi:hypothetical protein